MHLGTKAQIRVLMLELVVGHPPHPSCLLLHRRSSPASRCCTLTHARPPPRPFSSSCSSLLASRRPPPEWIEPFVGVSDLVDGPRLPSPWLPRILSIVATDDAVSLESELHAFCRRFLIRLSPSFVAHALRSSLGLHPGQALRFFRWASTQPGYPSHTPDAYAAIISLLSSSDRDHPPTSVRQLVGEMRDLGLPLTASASSVLLRSLGQMGLLEELLWAWRRMKESGVEPSLLSCNCLLHAHALVSSQFIASAEPVFEQMDDHLRPDVVSYNILIKGYCRAGSTHGAMARLRVMPNKGLHPDKITYLTIIQRHYCATTFHECLSLYHEMEENDIEIPPHAYSLVVSGLCKEGKPLEGLAILEDMTKSGCKPSVAIYTSLIDSFVKNGNEGQSMMLFGRMEDQGLEPDEVTYGVLINCLCKIGEMEKAMEWLEFCKEKGVWVNAIFYSSLIDGFGKAGMVEQAENLFDEMVDKGFVPDSLLQCTHRCVLQGRKDR